MSDELLIPQFNVANRPSNNEIISSTADFQTFWQNLAGQFKDNDLVIFDTSKHPPATGSPY